MKVLLTGANGYIGVRLLPALIEQGHEVILCLRDKSRINLPSELETHVSFFEVDFMEAVDVHDANTPLEFDAAFYLIHSMSSRGDFEEKEKRCAQNFVDYIDASSATQLVYLSGIINENEALSKHLRSRLQVEEILKTAKAKHTVLRAGIIVGSGSASFEIIRDLSEKLPIMVTPRWLNTKCQPIAIRNVIFYLRDVLFNEACYNQVFDIGGPEVLTYKQMLLQFADVRGLKRYIYTIPIMTPKLSSYWLYFVTATSYRLAVNLVNSMKIDVVADNQPIKDILPQKLFSYKEAVRLAFNKIEQNLVVSSWKDSLVTTSRRFKKLSNFIEIPKHGVFKDIKTRSIKHNSREQVINNIFSIGGNRGWYYATFLWKIRGFMDKLAGGVGLRRGRTTVNKIYVGDALDFWRVLVADREEGRLLLYAEMRLPGEAWLEFCVDDSNGELRLNQNATFRPKGIWGRVYWYTVLPFHYFVFNGMITNIEKYKPKEVLNQPTT
jgi:uncharacterized protein YbjT (DUF2867 family)